MVTFDDGKTEEACITCAEPTVYNLCRKTLRRSESFSASNDPAYASVEEPATVT